MVNTVMMRLTSIVAGANAAVSINLLICKFLRDALKYNLPFVEIYASPSLKEGYNLVSIEHG